MDLEIIIAVSIFLVSLTLLFLDKKLSLYILLILSVLLHKELFSIYRWNLLPIRLFMFAFLVCGVYEVLDCFTKKPDLKKVGEYLKEPFIFLLLNLWLIRGISIVFTRNLFTSVTLFGFFTTVVALGIYLYLSFKDNPDGTLKYIKFYIHVAFGLCIFAYFQAFLYLRTELIIGALWNVPGKFPRLGSLFWDVNHFGGLLAGLLPVLGVFILTAKSLKKKVWNLFMFFTMTSVLFFTNSRTSWILAFVAFVTFLTILLFRKFGSKGVLSIGVVLVLLFSGLLAGYMDKDSVFRRKIKDYFHYRLDSFDSHVMLLQGAFEVFEEYPILGGGYGGFFEHFSQTDVAAAYFGRDPAALNTRVPAHTIWGEVISETGVLGLVAFVLFVGLILSTILYLALNSFDKKTILLSSAMFSSIFGWLIAGIFYSYNSEFFFIVLFLYFVYAVATLQKDYDLSKILSFFARLKKIPFGIALGLAVLLIFVGLGRNHLVPWDEAIYAKIAKNMVESGEYVVQKWHTVDPWLEKPPLYMWLASWFMKLLGYTSLAARLPSAIFGLATIVLVYFFGSKKFGRFVGFVSSLALLTTVHFLYYSRASMLDVTTTFFITSSLISYYFAKEKNRTSLFVLSGALFGLAVMIKGVVGFLPLPIIGLYEIYLLAILKQKLSRRLFFNLSALFISGAVVFLPWHLAMYKRFGFVFLQKYIGYHVLERAMVAIEDKGRPFWWYFIVMKVSMRIWFVVLIPAFFYAIFKSVRKNKDVAFLTIWFSFILLFFSLARSKLVWYIIPVYPVASIICALFIKDSLYYAFGLFPKYNTSLVRFLAVFGLSSGILFYFFLNKELVYTSDLTRAQAELLLLKDDKFGESTKVYADRIELPLILFYSEGPFEVVDFGPLREVLVLGTINNSEVVFITKESRFWTYKEKYPSLKLEQQINEWVLGSLPKKEEIVPIK